MGYLVPADTAAAFVVAASPSIAPCISAVRSTAGRPGLRPPCAPARSLGAEARP